ncbi:hypothetical protein A9B99_17830 [Mangrovibacter phragmitis]|jgi:membrane protein DedA with SNARE-associated domain|uniref:VTT domain-containing protein n=1 Tax=Mangrovibacter phragmitis TaxID=1691903 RepID=A0A1B7KYH6_9ENTR|nr:DedA family protein [Mangrovibacter phragmitis]OAT75035.1 hypothetical protein A9B99_17830 [Mangrovibacter phragmitis]
MTALITALLHQDLAVLSQPGTISWIYCILILAIFLESALLPAAFLPGDSLLLLAGAMTAKQILPFYPTLVLLVVATGTGYWINYLSGRWLSHTHPVKKWLGKVPAHYHQRAQNLSHRFGPPALLVGRFIGFVRTLLPLLAGITALKQRQFHLFNWPGAILWVGTLLLAGRHLAELQLFKNNSAAGMAVLILLPLLCLLAGIIGSAWYAVRRQQHNKP